MDPLLAIRTASVPYWALFAGRPSLDRLARYLSQSREFDIRLGIFPHGTESVGLPAISEWQSLLADSPCGGTLVAVDTDHYPRHFRALSGFHRELSHLPRQSQIPLLDWSHARQYLAAHAAYRSAALT